MVPLRIIFSMITWQQCVAAVPRSYVYQKDVSEYCRRRAVPSVFLSRHVAEANAEILYFTKLDLPYNCYISIRTESSNNIIMVIQLTPGVELQESCRDSANQLVVYEFGETFGGYWGPIPEAVLRVTRTTAPRQYTLRTTPTTEIPHSIKPEEDNSKATITWPPTEKDDFIQVDVPLLNLTGELVPSVGNFENSYDNEENFDVLYDVTPGLTMLPVKSTGYRHYSNRKLWKPKTRPKSKNANLFLKNFGTPWKLYASYTYFLVFFMLFVECYLWQTGTKRKALTSFRKNNFLSLNRNSMTGSHTQEMITRKHNVDKHTNREGSYKVIEDLMKFLNKSADFVDYRSRLKPSYLPTTKNISDAHFYSSAYLLPWSVGTYLPVSKADIHMTNTGNRETTPIISTNSFQEEKVDSFENMAVYSIGTDAVRSTIRTISAAREQSTSIDEKNISVTSSYMQMALTKTLKNERNYNIAPNITTKMKGETKGVQTASNTRKSTVTSSRERFTQPSSGSLVGHESWENIVQVAPAIAGLLNQTPRNATRVPHTGQSGAHASDAKITRNIRGRGRRSLDPIPIMAAQPHAHRTSSAPAATARAQRVADTEHFAQLVELPDDEMSQRVALHFMRQYAGQTLFNICQQYEVEPKPRHLVLFNSSRIILALRNYTISRMTVVVTAARTLRGAEPSCPAANIECQVGGTRVCIDDTSACDGIPNCGALDIYDEDRVKCGAMQGLLHNVYLAAVAFLALLLTGLYIVNYWLKRCVPRVADAFFVYTDGTENVLYLDTVMRSPTDYDILTKNNGQSLFDDNMYSYAYSEERSEKFCQRLKTYFLKLMNIKEKRDLILLEIESQEKLTRDPHKMYSFAELEIQKISRTLKVDEEVQTGESMEMAFLKMLNSKKLEAPLQNIEKLPGDKLLQQSFESSSNKNITFPSSTYSADPSSVASLNYGRHVMSAEDEKELDSTFYDPHVEPFDEVLKMSGTTSTAQGRKRLRFDKKTRLISMTETGNEGVKEAHSSHRRSVALPQTSRPPRRNINLDIAPQGQEPTSDIRNFFTGKKLRKKKIRSKDSS